MKIDMSKLKKRSSLKDKVKQVEEMSGGGYQRDERIFVPGFDKQQGKGYAVVRFLPNMHDDSGQSDFVKMVRHNFKCGTNYYNEVSRKSLGQKEKDPVAISQSLLWNLAEETGDESYKKKYRERKATTKFYANVFVIKDTVTPENEGKVMIYQFGKQVFDKIQAAIKPEFEDDPSFDPFNVYEGANFKIKIKGNEIPDNRNPGQKVLVPNYEDAVFDVQTEFKDGDEDELQKLLSQVHDVREMVKVKTFEELAKRYKQVTGEDYDALDKANIHQNAASQAQDDYAQYTQQSSSNTSDFEDENEDAKAVKKAAQTKPDPEPSEADDDDEDWMKEFEAAIND